jgi:CO/xanthine dehydrogenase Mo-binding subunit
VLRQIVAEELQVPWQAIILETLDTAGAPVDTGVGASRSIRTYGNACYEAAVKAKEEIFRVAADCLGAKQN